MFSIEPFVQRNFDDVRVYGNPITDLRVNCPQCNDEKHHLHISIIKEVVHCFRCGYSANWFKFVMDITGYPYWRAVGELYNKPRMIDFNDIVSRVVVKPGEVLKMLDDFELPEDFINIVQGKGLIANSARYYLRRRGFDQWYWNKYNLGLADSIPARVIIPIEHGYWQGRKIFEWQDPKYLNPKEPARNILFNAIALKSYDEVVITEGAFSAMAVGDNSVALIGKEPIKEKIERLIDSEVQKFIVTIEPEAFPTMGKLADVLSRAGKEVVLWKYTVGDPADPSGTYIEMEYSLKSRILLMLN